MVQDIHGDDFGRRCLRVWTVLIERAFARETITYQELARIANVPMVLLVRGPLLPKIGEYCGRYGLPSLDVLAVNEGTGIPGDGYTGDPPNDTEEVWEFIWQAVPEPVVDDFR